MEDAEGTGKDGKGGKRQCRPEGGCDFAMKGICGGED